VKAPVSRVWRALTDYQQFGEWFCAKMDGPFLPGQAVRGVTTYPGYEGHKFDVVVQKVEPERLFSFTWHPYSVDPKIDYSKEPPTLVEFKLEQTEDGTVVLLSESGFEKVPEGRRLEAFRKNDEGWTEMIESLANYVTKGS
jgi:uncharacterized protein YndB with AHSA1/START domain